MIYYLGYYTCDRIRDEQRHVSPAAENKMSYLMTAFAEAAEGEIEVVSPAETKLNKVFKGARLKIDDRVYLKTFITFSSKMRLIRILGHLLTRIVLTAYLLRKIQPQDHLIVYHSLVYMGLVKMVKKIRKCRLTIEVEELYSDVTEDKRLREKELAYLRIADSYFFITELLKEEVDKEKPSIISHGTYRPVPDIGFRFSDERVHVVYAGTFNPTKGGALASIAAAEYLDERYAIDILGTGSKSEVQLVLDGIQKIQAQTNCTINYVGYKSGAEFNSLIQACRIGLSTQQPDGKFNATSFPSKILMYMSNGLKVVSVPIPAVKTSLVGRFVHYYDRQDGSSIAEAIRAATDDCGIDGRRILEDLHKKFVDELKDLL